MKTLSLVPRHTSDGQIETLAANHWQLSIAAGGSGSYRLAQMDDYQPLRRQEFVWQPPCRLSLKARASSNHLPGTWGFGLWNDPFGAGLANGGTRLLPSLPQAAWFFCASEENYLSFRDDLPAAGPLAGVFRSPGIPTWPFFPLWLGAPLLLIRPFSRMVRKIAAELIKESSVSLTHDCTKWHDYTIEWQPDSVRFSVDQQVVLESEVSPQAPLGLVIWLDNQFAAWRSDGRLNYGTLETPPAWIEIQAPRMT